MLAPFGDLPTHLGEGDAFVAAVLRVFAALYRPLLKEFVEQLAGSK